MEGTKLEEQLSMTSVESTHPVKPGTRVGKPKKQIVQNLFRYHERTKRTGELTRTFTIQYEYNRDTKTLKYGAAIFRPDAKVDRLDGSAHNQTAKRRFEKKPVVVENVEDTGTLKDFQYKIRNLIHTYGVSSSSNSNKKTKEVQVVKSN